MALSAAFFGLTAAAIGMVIGLVVPGYYYVMLPQYSEVSPLEPWKLGALLGLTQGLLIGVVVGCIVLLSVAWYKSRMQNSIAAMVAQAHALQSGSPQMDANLDEPEDVDLSKMTLKKTSTKKSN